MRILFILISFFIVAEITAQADSLMSDQKTTAHTIYLKKDFHDLFKSKFDFSLNRTPVSYQPQHTGFHPEMLGYMHGMFCAMEYKMESRMKIAPRFRLGSVNYTDWMEGKGEYYQRYWK